jgi:hypothetical protein
VGCRASAAERTARPVTTAHERADGARAVDTGLPGWVHAGAEVAVVGMSDAGAARVRLERVSATRERYIVLADGSRYTRSFLREMEPKGPVWSRLLPVDDVRVVRLLRQQRLREAAWRVQDAVHCWLRDPCPSARQRLQAAMQDLAPHLVPDPDEREEDDR